VAFLIASIGRERIRRRGDAVSWRTMKVLFLDFDGVLNSYEFMRCSPGRMDRLDPAAVMRLNAIVDRSGAKVVISSTWRLKRSLDVLRMTLADLGFRGEVIDRTPDLMGHGFVDPYVARCHEIQTWIDGRGEPLESYAILDDAYLEDVAQFLVRTETETGLLDEHVIAVLELLGEAPK
jgi:hypothetical protein